MEKLPPMEPIAKKIYEDFRAASATPQPEWKDLPDDQRRLCLATAERCFQPTGYQRMELSALTNCVPFSPEGAKEYDEHQRGKNLNVYSDKPLRLKSFGIMGQNIFDLFNGCGTIINGVSIPETAKIRHIARRDFNLNAGLFTFIIEDESFDPVAPGHHIPSLFGDWKGVDRPRVIRHPNQRTKDLDAALSLTLTERTKRKCQSCWSVWAEISKGELARCPQCGGRLS